MRILPLRSVVLGLTLGLAACGSSSSSTSPTSPVLDTPVTTTTITITSAGVTPNNIVVSAGARVTFVNNDSRSHNMTSDPHPDHTDCPPLNDVGFLAAGQTKASSNLTTIRTCGFHDHDDSSNAKLKGNIRIQ